MRTLMKYYKEFLVAFAVEVAVILLAKLPNNLGGTIVCPSSSTVCEWGWTLAFIVLAPLLAVIIWGKAEKRLQPIIQRIDQRSKAQRQKVFTLSHSDKSQNEMVCLELCIYKRFSVVDDLKGPDFSEFKPGKHTFDVAVVYGNGSIQWFVVKVIYTEPDKITLELPDA